MPQIAYYGDLRVRIIHRVTEHIDAKQQQQLAAVGIAAKRGLNTFQIDENESRWPEVEGLIKEWNALDIVSTKFTDAELARAKFLEMGPSWHHGYPQPEDDCAYIEQVYEISQYCASCGIGTRQIAPFQMKREPRWGKRQILQLNWVFDEYFCQPNVWKTVFQPIGIASWPVIDFRSKKELTTVVQLDVPVESKSKLDIPADAPSETCDKCGRSKYHPLVRGYFPRFRHPVERPIMKSQEMFGSGGSAWRAVIVSAEVYEAIKDNKVKGVSFVPLHD